MKSKAHIKGHPLHPMLIAFPVAFLTGTLIFDSLALLFDDAGFLQTAKYMEIAGIIGGLAAAIPGAIDYFYTVPPDSTAKSRATKHALVNITMLLIFTAAFIYRQNEDSSLIIIIGLEIIGMVLISIAGWMGATLVYRNQIGVNPRYAGAGKWKELYTDIEKGNIEVALVNDLKVDQMKLIHVKDKRIVLGRTEKGYVAFDDKCSHRGGSLAGGSMICGTVQCPWHGSQFDVNTGAIKAGPATESIKTYTIKEEEGKVFLVL